jgi:hypothetical protein
MTTDEILQSVEDNLKSAYNSLAKKKKVVMPEKKNFESLAKTIDSVEPLLEEITIEPKTTAQVFSPSGENEGINKVSVKPVTSDIDSNIIPSNIRKGKVILGVVGNVEVDKPDQEKTINPTRNTQSVVADSGYELARVTINAVTSAIDNNIQPSNIKKGVSILGVTGSLEGTLAPRLQEKTINPTTNTQSVTADYGYDGLSRVNVNAVVPSNYYKPEQTANIIPSIYQQTITAPSGSVFNKINVSAVTSDIDSNIQEENIKEGVTILGVTGTMKATSGSHKFAELVDGSITTIDTSDLSDVTIIRESAFEGTSLVSVEIPNNVQTIGDNAFAGCSSLQSLSLGDGIQGIGDNAFAGIAIEELTLPASLTEIGDNAFANSSLSKIHTTTSTPATIGTNAFGSNVSEIYVLYGAYDNYVSSWSEYADKIVRLPAIPSTITVTANNYLGELVSGASVTITGNGQTYTGTTDSAGVFSQGDLQPATYTISVADLEGFKTPDVQEVVVEEDTQNSVIVTYLEKPASVILGVSWTNDNSTTMTRTDDAVGMTYTINEDGTIQSDFNSVFPYNEMEIVTDDYGNEFVRMPKMYFRVGTDNGTITSVAVSNTQTNTGDWYEVESFDYGRYGGSVSNSRLCSVSDVSRPHSSNYDRGQFRTFASANTENGYLYHQLDLKHRIVMLFLWWIEWADKNSQNIMTGTGSKINTGGTNELSTPSGFNTKTNQMRWHYIEDFVGNAFEWVDGIIKQDRNVADFVTADPSKFSDTNTSGMKQLSWANPNFYCTTSWGWDSDKPFLVTPKTTVQDASYSIGFCDRGYTFKNYTMLFTGAGYSNIGNDCGVSNFYATDKAYNDFFGGRLLRVPV